MVRKQKSSPTHHALADLNIPPALHFRCAVQDRDPVYSAEPVLTLVFGARCFSWESDLWSRYGQIARGWHRAAELGTGGPDYGPVSTWYRSRSVFLDRDYSVSRFPGSVETCSFAWLVAPVLRVIPSNSSSLARAAEKTGPSGCCPGTMTTVHSNVHKHRATKRVRLTFGSHFEIFPVSFSRRKEKTGPSGGRCCRASLPLLLSTSGLINARPQSMHPVSLWLFARRGLTTLPFANFVIFWKNELAF